MHFGSKKKHGMTFTGCISHVGTDLPPPLPSRNSFLEGSYEETAIDSSIYSRVIILHGRLN